MLSFINALFLLDRLLYVSLVTTHGFLFFLKLVLLFSVALFVITHCRAVLLILTSSDVVRMSVVIMSIAWSLQRLLVIV